MDSVFGTMRRRKQEEREADDNEPMETEGKGLYWLVCESLTLLCFSRAVGDDRKNEGCQ